MIDEDQQSRESRDLIPSFEILNGPLRKVPTNSSFWVSSSSCALHRNDFSTPSISAEIRSTNEGVFWDSERMWWNKLKQQRWQGCLGPSCFCFTHVFVLLHMTSHDGPTCPAWQIVSLQYAIPNPSPPLFSQSSPLCGASTAHNERFSSDSRPFEAKKAS